MAITFTGTVQSALMIGNDALTQNLFVITNGFKSGVNMIIKKLSLRDDAIAVLTSVKPQAKVSRATGISGGIILGKGSFSTLESSDANIEFRSAMIESSPITATPGTIISQRMIPRMHTAVEQQRPKALDLLPKLISSNDFILRPNESLLIQIVSSAVNVNAALTNNYVIDCVWQEDAIATFAISGTVTLSGSPVENAEVMVIEADDTDGTNAYLREVKTTNAGGNWSSTIRTGKIGFAYVAYKNGSSEYTAAGNPFLDET
jgi:hypothetical protein